MHHHHDATGEHATPPNAAGSGAASIEAQQMLAEAETVSAAAYLEVLAERVQGAASAVEAAEKAVADGEPGARERLEAARADHAHAAGVYADQTGAVIAARLAALNDTTARMLPPHLLGDGPAGPLAT